MQQTEEAVNHEKLLGDIPLQKEDFDPMCSEHVGRQLTPEDFDTDAEQCPQSNCRWLRTKRRSDRFMSQEYKSLSLPKVPRQNSAN